MVPEEEGEGAWSCVFRAEEWGVRGPHVAPGSVREEEPDGADLSLPLPSGPSVAPSGVPAWLSPGASCR